MSQAGRICQKCGASFEGHCKPCRAAYMRDYYARNREKVRAQQTARARARGVVPRKQLVAARYEEGKACSRCGEFFPDIAANFSPDGNSWSSQCKRCRREERRASRAARPKKERRRLSVEESAERRRQRYAVRKEEHRARDRARYESRKEQRKAYLATYNEANRERLLQEKRDWYAENKERLAPRMRATSRQWQRENPERVRTNRLNRVAREKNAPGKHTAADVRAKYEEQEGCCRWCGVYVGETYHVDHVIPLSKGGSNGPENICIACPPCNCQKNASMPEEFLRRKAS